MKRVSNRAHRPNALRNASPTVMAVPERIKQALSEPDGAA